jgi:hypothetical protein
VRGAEGTGVIDDAELVALALAADPEPRLGSDAVPLSLDGGAPDERLLPSWYMPAPPVRSTPLAGWRRVVAYVIVGTFVAIAASGLCSTYGQLVPAF